MMLASPRIAIDKKPHDHDRAKHPTNAASPKSLNRKKKKKNN
jgi:hypothetical protein